MARITFTHSYEDIISLENLLIAWQEFIRGKRLRADVLNFERNLMLNLLSLNERLVGMTYRHCSYESFNISDPKPRVIHKASVGDRVLHRALYRRLYPFFDRTFIHDSYSCRNDKGTHRALKRFTVLARRASANHRRTAWVLKCDIRKFFASIDHEILMGVLNSRIGDKRIVWLISQIVNSYNSGISNAGLPLGNLTSQLFANVYMDLFDKFVKHELRTRFYIRYVDDFLLMSDDPQELERSQRQIKMFLWQQLRLEFHPYKNEIKALSSGSGVDFLGWVHFTSHRVLRTSTKRRMLNVLNSKVCHESAVSYRAMLQHGNAMNLINHLDSIIVGEFV